MPHYTITVQNHTLITQTYLLFSSSPELTALSTPQPFPDMMMTSRSHIPPHGSTTFHINFTPAGDFRTPLAPMPMQPAEQSTVVPVAKFYIGSGSATVGEVLDVKEIGGTIMIDFTSGPVDAVVVHGVDLLYTRIS